MAQHDYIISNQTFPNTRADINSVLSAISTNNSGTSAPTTQYAGQFWIDTTSSTWTLYIHDGSDDIQFATIDTSANTVNFIDSELADGSVTNAKLGADAVDGTKIADDSINSEHYVDSSIDTAHIADSQITTAKINDSAVTPAKLGYNYNQYRNLIINGDMSIAQRGTSFSGAEYTLDRWSQSLSGGTATVTQETFSVGSEIAQSKNYLRQNVSSGNNFLGITQRVESVRSIKSGGSVTFSFYAKGTNPAGGGLNFHVEQRFGTGGSPSSNVVVYDSDTEIVLTSDWTRYTITFTFTDYTGKTFGNNNDDYIQVEIRQKGSDTSTDAWTLDITGVQLEAGTTASDFEFLPVDVNLNRCQRYFQIVNTITGNATTTSIADMQVQPINNLRTSPTVSQNGVVNVYDDQIGSFTQSSTGVGTLGTFNTKGGIVRLSNFSGLTTNRFLLTSGSSNGITLSAEL